MTVQFTITDLKALRYVDTSHEELTFATSDNLSYDLEVGKEYKITAEVNSNTNFDSIGFDLNWNSSDVEIKELNGAVVKEDGSLFSDVSRSVVANLFASEQRLYLANIADRGQSPNTSGSFTIIAIFVKLVQATEAIHVHLTIEEVTAP